MGRLTIIAVLIAAAVITVLMISLSSNRESVTETTTQNLAEVKAKSLSTEAINYGIKQLRTSKINFVNNAASLTFQNFSVLDGKINSINYSRNAANDSIRILADVSYITPEATIQKTASALIHYVPANIQAAVSANGDVIVKGNAAVVGDIDENIQPPLDFEEIIGVTSAYVQSIATNTYINPSNNPQPCTGITWISITNPSGSAKFTTANWSGSGLMVIDGDADFSGGYFYGILWITGELRITGNLVVAGALFVEGGTEIAATVISGSPTIEFSVQAVSDFLGTVSFPTKMEFNLVDIYYD
jgi:hypothetical protein